MKKNFIRLLFVLLWGFIFAILYYFYAKYFFIPLEYIIFAFLIGVFISCFNVE